MSAASASITHHVRPGAREKGLVILEQPCCSTISCRLDEIQLSQLPQPVSEERPTWALVAGLIVGVLTLLFLMAFPVITLLTGKRVECGDIWSVILAFALGLGLASAFLGGYAAVSGDVHLPFAGGQPIATAAVGGLVFVCIGAGIAYLVSSNSCVDPEYVQSSFANWGYDPEANVVKFRLQENRVSEKRLVRAGDADGYNVYVAVRAHGDQAANRGEYPIVFGPLQTSTSLIEKQLSPGDADLLRSSCLEFVAFGVKSPAEAQEFTVPFRPQSRMIVFDEVGGGCRSR